MELLCSRISYFIVPLGSSAFLMCVLHPQAQRLRGGSDSSRGPTILLTFCLKRMMAASAFGDCIQSFWYNTLNLAGVHYDESWMVCAGTVVPPPSPDTITAFARQWEWASRRSRADGKALWATLDCVATFKARSLLSAHTRRRRRPRVVPRPTSAMAHGNGPRAPGLSVTFAPGLSSPREARAGLCRTISTVASQRALLLRSPLAQFPRLPCLLLCPFCLRE